MFDTLHEVFENGKLDTVVQQLRNGEHRIVIKDLLLMKAEAGKICRHILRSPGIDLSKKLCVTQTYLFSKGLFQSGTWPEPSAAGASRLHHTVVNIYRECVGQIFRQVASAAEGLCHIGASMLSDAEIIERHGLMSVATLVRFSRLCLFGRVEGKASQSLVALLRLGVSAKTKASA